MTTKDFLSHFKGFYIKTLDDKHSKDAIPFREALAEIQTEGPPSKFSGPQLAELNSRGAGIFFTPNNFSKGLGRKAEQCEGINAWFAESDSLTKGEQMFNILASPLEPSFVVETAKSFVQGDPDKVD
jgi:hypothetical protein